MNIGKQTKGRCRLCKTKEVKDGEAVRPASGITGLIDTILLCQEHAGLLADLEREGAAEANEDNHRTPEYST